MLKCYSLFFTDMFAAGQNEEADPIREAARRQWYERWETYFWLSYFGSYVLYVLGDFNYIDVFIANQVVCVFVYVLTKKAGASSIYTLLQSITLLVAYMVKDYPYMQWVTVYLLFKNFEQFHLGNVPPPIGTLAIPFVFQVLKYFGGTEKLTASILWTIALPAFWNPWQVPLNWIVLQPLSLSVYLIQNAGELTYIYLLGSLVITIPIFYMHESILSEIRRRNNL